MISNTLLIVPNMCLDIFISVVAAAGRLVGLLVLGTWIADGLRLMHMSVGCDDIHKIGAALGFMKGVLRISRSSGPNNAARNSAMKL